jgi:hypothetical protein
MFTPEESTSKDIILHLECEDESELVNKLVAELKNKGYPASARKRC